jgi:diphosphomevalonate decarboxylase
VRLKRYNIAVSLNRYQSTARAYSNIALIKYWGKRDDRLALPNNSSISMTLDQLYSETTVTFRPDLDQDVFCINGAVRPEAERFKVSRFLDILRQEADLHWRAEVLSTNTVPTAAGLASSASGFAALALAAYDALGIEYHAKKLSQVARMGSGSASRSIYGGFVEWHCGELSDGSDCYASQIAKASHWDIKMAVAVLEGQQKSVSSREGMKRTVKTSPFYPGWLATIEQDLNLARRAILERDFEKLGRVAEANALKMHASMLAANPPFTYWQPSSLKLIHKIWALRQEGLPIYFTMDAGPNIKILYLPEDESVVCSEFRSLPEVKDWLMCAPGPAASLIKA